MADDQFRQLERELGLFMRRSQASSTSIAREVHPDLEPSAYALLALIAVTPGVRASDLAATIGVGRGTMSRQLARLGSIGLVARQPDPDDYRGQLLELTDEGQRLFELAQQARRAYFRRALGAWSEAEVMSLARQLGRLNEDLSAVTLANPAH